MESAVQKSYQLSFDLFQPLPVGGALLVQEPGDFWSGFHHALGEMLDFQIHHFLDQLYNCLSAHNSMLSGIQAESVLDSGETGRGHAVERVSFKTLKRPPEKQK